MEEIKVNLDNLTDEEREILFKLVEKGNKSNKRWRGEKQDTYFSVSGCGDIINYIEYGYNNSEQSYKLGNYFETEKEATFTRDKQYIYQKLKDYALEHNTKEIDWNNSHQNKWFISYNHINDELCIGSRQSVEFLNTVYFTSGEIAVNAIDEIGEDNIKKYLFGVEE